MKLSNLITDDDAVSPVIGVILMVAITVILAAVIGAFVLNIGGSQEAAPQATLQWQTVGSSPYDVEVTHQSGEALPNSEVSITVEADGTSSISAGSFPTELTAGDTTTVATKAEDGDSVSLVWDSPNSDKSSIIASYTV